MNAFWRGCASLLVLAILSGCTSKGDDDVPSLNPNPPGNGGGGGSGGHEPGEFLPAETFANRCESPRTGVDPFTNEPYPDVQGSYVDENNFLRSWTNDTYLWYDEVPDLNPADYSDAIAYFAHTSSRARRLPRRASSVAMKCCKSTAKMRSMAIPAQPSMR
jgi:carboxyl-terminal processing protease